MKRATLKAMAESKNRKVYYLTDEEAEAVDAMRADAQWKKTEARRKSMPTCQEPRCVCVAKQGGYCLNHYKMHERRKRLEL